MNRLVALKVLQPRYVNDPECHEQFNTEARTAARLDHPAIIPVLDHGVDEGTPYIAFPFVRGLSLERLIDFRRLTWPETVIHGIRLAQALQAIHAAGIVHRDLKPANVLINEQGEAMVTDFGLSKPIETQANRYEGVVMGTAGYIAPERFRGEPDRPSADLYSLGILLFEMLSGYRPFERANPLDPLSIREPQAEIKAASGAAAPALPECEPEVPQELAVLIGRLLEVNPERRPANATEVSRELAYIAATHGPSAPAGSFAQLPSLAQAANQQSATPTGGHRIGRETGKVGRRPWLTKLVASAVVALSAMVLAPYGSHMVESLTPLPPVQPSWIAPKPLPAYFDWSCRAAVRAAVSTAGDRIIQLSSFSRDEGRSVCPLVVSDPTGLAGTRLEMGACRLIGIEDPTAGFLEADINAWHQVVRPGLNWLVVDDTRQGPPASVYLPPSTVPANGRDDTPSDAPLWNQVMAENSALGGWSLARVSVAEERFGREQPYATRAASRAMRALLQLEREHGATENLTLAGTADPSCAGGPLLTSSLRDRLDEAQAAVDMDPSCWSAWQVLGIMLYHARQWDGARSAFTHALTIWPNSYWTWLSLNQLESALADRQESAPDALGADLIDHRHLALEYLGWARHHLSQLQRTPGIKVLLARLDALHAQRRPRR